MRDYVTTVFNLLVGLVNPNKIVLLAFVGLAIIVVWQLLSLMLSFNSRLSKKCRKISKFLTTKGLSADNYNKFIALIAKMPQEFIRGYKAFEHASFGLPSDYIKRFDSIDVEVNGGIFNHGKSILKSFIYTFGAILLVLSLALMGEESTLTGYGLADAMLVPLLFVIIAKVLYYVFVAIKQQQYRVVVDEFNEMLDIMNDKIENNDTLPGPDVLAEIAPFAEGTITTSPNLNKLEEQSEVGKVAGTVQTDNTTEVQFNTDINKETDITKEESSISNLVADNIENNSSADVHEQTNVQEDEYDWMFDYQSSNQETSDETNLNDTNSEQDSKIVEEQTSQKDSFSYQELEEEVSESIKDNFVQDDNSSNDLGLQVDDIEQSSLNSLPKTYSTIVTEVKTENILDNTTSSEEKMEEKRGRGRPKKAPEGELIITSDKQFEEVLERAEKLMRKSEEALSASQAKRVEKALKQLVDAMTKYKEEK